MQHIGQFGINMCKPVLDTRVFPFFEIWSLPERHVIRLNNVRVKSKRSRFGTFNVQPLGYQYASTLLIRNSVHLIINFQIKNDIV